MDPTSINFIRNELHIVSGLRFIKLQKGVIQILSSEWQDMHIGVICLEIESDIFLVSVDCNKGRMTI